jgi:hypothetical protein
MISKESRDLLADDDATADFQMELEQCNSDVLNILTSQHLSPNSPSHLLNISHESWSRATV